jgi:hypothetical protein
VANVRYYVGDQREGELLMLTIRQAQLAVFSQLEVQKFEDWMLVHLHRFFPGEYASAGKAQLRKIIQDGIHRAAYYQITSRRDVCKYIDLMIVFGHDFDTNNRLPGAEEILSADATSDAKMRTLYALARKNLTQT